jgi:hypothetical protein
MFAWDEAEYPPTSLGAFMRDFQRLNAELEDCLLLLLVEDGGRWSRGWWRVDMENFLSTEKVLRKEIFMGSCD